MILFGSYARGDAGQCSDTGLLVVMPDAANRRPLAVAMRRALRGMGLSEDVLALSRAEYEAARDIPGSLAYLPLTRGRCPMPAGDAWHVAHRRVRQGRNHVARPSVRA